MAKRPHPNDDQRKAGYLHTLVTKKAANAGSNGSTGYVADWSVFDCRLLGEFIWAVCIQGGSCLFGQTRNHAVLTLTIYSGDDKANWYFNQDENGMDAFYALAASLIEVARNSPEGLDCPYKGQSV